MLNHLFGTKFDISGGRCTDGGWLSARIIDDILYIVCDFEGLGSFERSPQEDMLLATFNAAVSNCTIFKCDNRFDRTVEDMFNKFQSGVKIMAGSKDCFVGSLMLVIKDVVDTGAEAAVADFQRHIQRLAHESELIKDADGKVASSFFVSQMYGSGLEIIPFPPLANEAFFSELNDTLEAAIEEIEIIINGGKIFLDHFKLIMAKLNVGDFSAMSGEQAKIRMQEIRDSLKNAVEAGCITNMPSTQYVTFQVDEEQNLLLLDGNKLITPDIKDVTANIKHYQTVIDEFAAIEYKMDVEGELLRVLDSINDAGLRLTDNLSVKVLEFLLDQFETSFPRNHNNFKEWTALYQLFLELIFYRRKQRVLMYVTENTKKFENEKVEIEAMVQSANSRLNALRDRLKICRQKCDECFFPCLLLKNHEEDARWGDKHTCGQAGHTCQVHCTYCKQNGKEIACGLNCGHRGAHNCKLENHTCGKKCSMIKYGGCQKECDLISGHDGPCKCAAETHLCPETCGVKICKNPCRVAYNKPHTEHICIQQQCPYKCQVKIWDESIKKVIECGRPCSCQDHDHQLRMDRGECKDEGHICDEDHPCPKECTEPGICKVEVQRKVVEKATYTTGAGDKIEYDAYAEVNAEKKRCALRIPVGLFRHEGEDHRCYDGDRVIHTCEEQCDTCGYYCDKEIGHYEKDGSFHDCVHGNMRNTIFYATEDIVDTGGRKYKVGDSGRAEMCNIFCERQGRGHIHLELCSYGSKEKCVEEEGRRHQTKPYMPNPEIHKDEVKHSKYWRRKKWQDPCVEKMRKEFDLCNFVCGHTIHEERAAKGEEDDEKYCVEPLWHAPFGSTSGHHFQCSHPFANSHVIFICDISGSMSYDDEQNSVAEFTWITDANSHLDNRLGALYSSIHKFIDIRISKGCNDTVSAIMTPPSREIGKSIAAQRVTANVNFVKDYLLEISPQGCEDYGQGFRDALGLIDEKEDTVVIFLTDGYSCDNGAASMVQTKKQQLEEQFNLFCITLGPEGSTGDNLTVKGICNAAGGEMVKALNGNELGATFSSIAKQMNLGAFGTLT